MGALEQVGLFMYILDCSSNIYTIYDILADLLTLLGPYWFT